MKLNKIILIISTLFVSKVTKYEIAAQVLPDNTLGSESSTVQSINNLRNAIEGGAIRGDNLFHSFSEFNVGEGVKVDFANPEGITNIFSRVTGGNISEIFGSLGVDGSANLFFMNPNGIVFGENAAIDIGGSFLATTAKSIEFNNGEQFSSIVPNKPLLTINFPIGLSMGSNPGNIVIRGIENNVGNFPLNPASIAESNKFNIGENQTLAIIGGNIVFDRAVVTVESGRFEIGSVKDGNLMLSFDPLGIKIEGYKDILQFQNVELNSNSFIGIQNGGEVKVNANNLALLEGSSLGSANINTDLESTVGNIFVDSHNLFITGGSNIGSASFNSGLGGNVQIKSESIEIIGTDPIRFLPSTISASTLGSGTAGKLIIETSELVLKDGAEVSSSTLNSGSAGTVNINANESIIVEGVSSNQKPSQIIAGGNILVLSDSFSFDSSLFLGNGGNITINTPKLKIYDGAAVTAQNDGTGDGGELIINADQITLDTSAQISASTLSGQGGNITLKTYNLKLLNQSQITASAGGFGDGGNITIDSDTILGIQNSDITANAIGGDGGNIVINSDFIIGLEARSQLTPFNDITATSEFGIDGTVTINSPDTNIEEDALVSAKEVDFDPYRKLFEGSCLDPNRKGRQELVYIGAGRPESPYNFFDDDEPQALIDSYPPEFNNLDSSSNNIPPLWQEGDPLIEPNAVQTNPDGRKFLVAVEQKEISEPNVCTRNAEDLKMD